MCILALFDFSVSFVIIVIKHLFSIGFHALFGVLFAFMLVVSLRGYCRLFLLEAASEVGWLRVAG